MSLALSQLLPDMPLPASLAATPVSALCLDSRRISAGDTFVALAGHQQDGRVYIEQAIAGGATLVLAEADETGVVTQQGVPVIGIAALRQQLGVMAARLFGEPGRAMTVTGITGTNGKTSTSWFLCDALNAVGRACALVGTLGLRFADALEDVGHTTPDPITLQRALARFRDEGAQAVVMEVSSHALDQGRLNGTPVSVAVFTNLSRDHLDYHGDMEQYLAAKAKLFEGADLSLAVINLDDPAGVRLRERLPARLPCITFGDHADAMVRCKRLQAGAAGIRFVLNVAGAEVAGSVPLYGRFNLDNLMAVAAVLHGLGYDAAAMERAFAAVTPVPGRMQPVTLAGAPAPVVLVDYAHTPDGLDKALRAARAHFAGRLHCVVGCGGNRDRGKRPEMAAVAEQLADVVVLTSDNPRFESPQAILADMRAGLAQPERARIIVRRDDAIAEAIGQASDDDVVLIAGKGHETYQEIQGQRYPMDDRALALAALQARRAGGEGA
ncbi:UDP-N-acetylmuramoylalanyl-D-glutamate--2, 6-diaminopimelate ligase [Alcanivorax sp. S71-1-4]|uniref:UDP-N-acetylmuramoyl-L-alanyl-D-glutamate--2, 6-diaminopimelate ligase n=1 Tax=Alcanivorax sp. S71-1-4 TaxID=1177159 RepID=UPI00135B2C7E|nr:UDP-N-acetylmuramoyl-L-alanyl-D-glutamate--2,6-diaminopimelate ligase [Alcanivorax sp. S71-1-4]KAF0808961.1 UDP-N-acetylmuramoylalanyl-D-glutamate--2, 6-diaminopimelate ligase [Alcanivorax sp. S71-1-4]